jgi:uncharacterized protein (DUF983 family)
VAEVVPPSRTGTVLKWGFTRRCAVCGSGHLFHQWLRMDRHCPHCGHRFLREPGHWCGSWFLNLCMAQLVAVVYLIIASAVAWPDPPSLLVAIVGLVVTLACSLLFFPYSRTIWCAIDLAMKPLELDDDVPPGYELEAEIEAFFDEIDRNAAPSAGDDAD